MQESKSTGDNGDEKWILNIRCYRRTLISRDSGVTREYNSLEECKDALRDPEEPWNSISYSIRFASATGPDGKKIALHGSTS